MSGWEADERADRILAQTTALLAQRGDERAVALLIDVRSMEFVLTDEEVRREPSPWSDETYIYHSRAAMFDVEDYLIPQFTVEVRERIAAILGYVAKRYDEDDVKYVQVRPALPEVDGQWREAYAAHLSAERPTNQARRERGIAQYPTQDGLTFGSSEELRVYRALRRLQDRATIDDTIAIMPLPSARLRADHTWSP